MALDISAVCALAYAFVILVLEPYFDAFGQRLLGSSSFAVTQGLATQLK
jgi:hypothetical protein